LVVEQSLEVRATSEWIGRFSARVLNLAPEVSPLDAVRRAMAAFPGSGDLAPEIAAEIMVSGNARTTQ
jgi:hypothetical protein